MRFKTALACGLLFLFFTSPMVVSAATPFDVPAVFTLADRSDIELGLSVKVGGQTLQAGLDPNPAPVTGFLDVNTLNRLTGVFTGAFREVTASTTASVDRLGWQKTITATLNAPALNGIFLWNENKVIIYPETVSAVFTVDGEALPVFSLQGVPLRATYEGSELTISTGFTYEGSYAGFQFTMTAKVNLVAALQTPAAGTVWVGLKTDDNAYQAGDGMKVYGSIENSGESVNVDLYLALYAPDGKLYCLPGFTTTFVPILSDWTFVPTPNIPYTLLLQYTLPDGLPIPLIDGQYAWMAAFFKPGTTELIGDVAAAWFAYTANAPTPQAFDGYWLGTAESLVQSPDCRGFAEVSFTVTGGNLKGDAVTAVDDGDAYSLSGTVDAGGNILNGAIFEEFAGRLYQVGVFKGTLAGDTGQGNWYDDYGCHGTFSVLGLFF